jgi:hypothetical protein
MNRRSDLARFYEILAALEKHAGGRRQLATCDGRMGWPERGVYFFFDPGESRSDTGEGPRVVRVGTHALKSGSSRSLWSRLSAHRGTRSSGGGGHRASIFRLLVGVAIRNRDRRQDPVSWGRERSPGIAARKLGVTREALLAGERLLEIAVSKYIQSMPFIWVAVPDAPGPGSDRGLIERGSIALLSNYKRPPIDTPSKEWLGSYCDREEETPGHTLRRRAHCSKGPTHAPSLLEHYVS